MTMTGDDEASGKRQERIPVPELSDELLEHIFSHIEDDDGVLATVCALNRHWRDAYLKRARVERRRVSELLTISAILGALRRCTDRSFTMFHVVTAVHNVAPDLESTAVAVRELLRDASRRVPLRQVLDAMPRDVQCAAWRLMVTYDSLLVTSRPVECLKTSDQLGLLEDDDVLAVRLNRLAADQGDAEAQYTLGRLHEQRRGGLLDDRAEAARLFRLAADQGYAVAQYKLGIYHEHGRGGLSRDVTEAARLYLLAADQGNAQAQYNLAFLYEFGRGGLSRDEAEAARLYRLAADQGDAFAQCALGTYYEEGRGGLTRDYAETARLYRLAANQGNGWAKWNLSLLRRARFRRLSG